jgi:hypothetical protein
VADEAHEVGQRKVCLRKHQRTASPP